MTSDQLSYAQSLDLPEDWHEFLNSEYPLHKAARYGRLDILKAILSLDSSVNMLNHDRETPLHEACFGGHYKCVEFLLDNFATINDRSIDSSTPLCQACAMGRVECVQLLLERGAIVNPPFVLCTPLHEAVLRDNAECCALLINGGAKLEASDCDSGTALHAACFRNSAICTRLLLQAGACVNAVKNHRSSLHIAASNNNEKIVVLLLAFGADVYRKNNFGKKPRDLAPQGSAVARILCAWEDTPQNLQHYCRLAIHRAVRPRNLNMIIHLNIPKSLIKYILC